jgi:hypothetical protein
MRMKLQGRVREQRGRNERGCASPRHIGMALVMPLVLLTGCQSVPTAQLKAFTDSLAAVQEADKPIFADLAQAEMRGALARPDACPDMPSIPVPVPGGQLTQIRDGFCLKEVTATANIADPPDTMAFKGGMEALQVYAGTLNTLASGASANDTAAQLQSAAGNLLGIASALNLVGSAFAPAISGAIGALASLVTQASQQLSKAEARRLILSGDQHVHELIAAERAAVPSIWAVITGDWRSQLRRVKPGDTQTAATLRGKIETYRTIMSNYIIMLDRLDTAWTKTVKATNDPQPTTLADLVTLSGQLKADADTLAKAYAFLRSY